MSRGPRPSGDENVNGNFIAHFSTREGDMGAGVVVIDSGRVFGGDNGFVYDGVVSIERRQVVGWIRIARYFVGQLSVFGDLDRLMLDVTGELAPTGGRLIGRSAQVPGVVLTIDLSRHDTPVSRSAAMGDKPGGDATGR